ncbi:MAG: rhomboid family intramembrane serine protease [Pseudobdellovibrionaceae bacterium]|jgi:membrane associated rhomboid family serine protease
MNRYQQPQVQWSITPTVKWLMILNVGIWFVFQVLAEKFFGLPFSQWFALFPSQVLFDFYVWQLFSYMFLHSYSVFHIFFNMLLLWFVGVELEQRWGKKAFLGFYLITGVGAALIYVLGMFAYSFYDPSATGLIAPVMGASGAIFGLLLAYGILFGERTVYVMMAFPMKAKYMVMIMGAVEFASLLTADVNGGNVAYLAHLGGLASGYLALLTWTKWQTASWSQKAKKKKGNLRLVVDNEDSGKTPKYWN